MKMHIFPTLLSLLALASTGETYGKSKNPKDAILLSNVKSLTLRADKKTSHRRVSAIPQLSCQGPGCKHFKIDVMRCTNQGADYNQEDVQWSCTASIPEDFKLGSTDVICEGYDSPDDDRVLKGSCGVEYRLLLTEKGEEKYGTTWWGGSKAKEGNKGKEEGTDLGGYLFFLVFVAVLFWILYSMWNNYDNPPIPGAAGPRRGGGGGGGGGGWWGGGDDPPPPYPGPPYQGRKSTSSRSEEGWRPGFWSGLAGGAAAGYMAGNRGGRQQEPPPRNNSWFGGGGGNTGGAGGWGGGGRSPNSSSSSSGTRYESTGFGSTSRR